MMPFNVGAAGSTVEFLKVLELASKPKEMRLAIEEMLEARRQLDEKQREVEDSARKAQEEQSRAAAAVDAAELRERKAAVEVERVQADRDLVLKETETAKRELMLLKEEFSSLAVVRDATSARLEELRAHTIALQEAHDSLKAEHEALLADRAVKLKEAEDLEKRLEKARTQIAKLLG